MTKLNETTILFLDELKQDPNVLGIILFGSWARGNNRRNSDVDLIVIQREGYKRAVEKRGEQVFEIIYITADAALQFWESHLNDAASLWEVAQVLFDKEGKIELLAKEIKEILAKGKPQIDSFQLGQYRFDAEDQVEYASVIKKTDIVTANIILYQKVFDLTAKFFDVRQLFTPAPKQRLQRIKELNPKLAELLEQFYLNSEIEARISIAKQIIVEVFEME